MITKAQFGRYVAVQESGVTNMFALDVVTDLANLTREQAIEIMKNYTELRSQFEKA